MNPRPEPRQSMSLRANSKAPLSRTKQITLIALLTALALALGFVESMIPVPLPVPGVKLGLGNICILLALYLTNVRCACAVTLLKVGFASLLFGSLFALAYSIAGALCAFAGMWLLSRWARVNLIVVSIAAAMLHNFGQILVAAWLLETAALFWYLPVLCVAACVTGAATGVIATGVLKAIGSQR